MTRKIIGCPCGCKVWRVVQEDDNPPELLCYACGVMDSMFNILPSEKGQDIAAQ